LIQDAAICTHVYRLSPWLCGPCNPTGPPISRAPKKNSPAGRGIFVYEASSGPVHVPVNIGSVHANGSTALREWFSVTTTDNKKAEVESLER